MKTTAALAIVLLAIGACSSTPAPGGHAPRSAHPAAAPVRGVAIQEKDTSCKLEFVGPGEKCGSYGTCPETAHRSFLWGLVEYDTRIVLCWCLTECDISL